MLSDKHAGDSLIVHLIPEGAPIQALLGWVFKISSVPPGPAHTSVRPSRATSTTASTSELILGSSAHSEPGRLPSGISRMQFDKHAARHPHSGEPNGAGFPSGQLCLARDFDLRPKRTFFL
jgi:hypothetical protein